MAGPSVRPSVHVRGMLQTKQTALSLGPYLEGLAELVGHDVVEHRVHSGGQVVENAGGVGQCFVHGAQERAVGLVAACVDRQQALGVERRPANEEGHNHCNCKQSTRIGTVRVHLVNQEEDGDLGSGCTRGGRVVSDVF